MNAVVRKAAQAATAANVWLYRRSNGRVGGRGLGRIPLLLLTVPGRHSGTPHTVPVACFDHNGGFLVVGTGMGGTTAIPQWFLNLRAAGMAHVQLGDREHDFDAQIIGGAQREAVWPQIAARAPHFAKWERRTGRQFPIAELTAHSAAG